jgi:predicted nucleic acid-binding protein
MRELKTPLSRWLGLKKTFQEWSLNGRIVLHGLDEQFMEQALIAAVRYKTRGADTTFVALADQLTIPLKTFDSDIIARYSSASLP